ncbi:MAG: peptidyl-tRNA hydrolase, partial [Proteobacteria bacterium]
MKLLVGLGNPGRQHVINRHNLGFLAVEAYVLLRGEDVIVMKPQTYMNRSGDGVGEAMRFFKIAPEDMIVLHDELDVAPMSFKIKKGGGHAGHNGLRSLQPLGENYWRFRLGIGR